MSNAMNELKGKLAGIPGRIKCATITVHDKEIVLKLNYTEKEELEFYERLNLDYDSGYGGQELYGTVWLEDGTWLERGEYDGSEWWEHKYLPPIPTECIRD